MHQKRVLIVSRIHLPEPSAASNVLDSQEKEFLRRHWEVEVITTTYKSAEDKNIGKKTLEHKNLTIKRWPVKRNKQGYVRGYIEYLSFDIPVFFRILAAKRPDMVYVEPPPTTGVIATIACKLKRVPLIWDGTDLWSLAAKSAGSPAMVVKVLEVMEKFIIKNAAYTICATSGVQENYAKLLGVYPQPAPNMSTIPVGADAELFNLEVPAPSAPELAAAGITGPYFIYAGLASERHGALIFVDALKIVRQKYPQTQLLFIGQGSDWESIDQMGQEIAPDAVIQLPLMPAEELARWQAGAVAALASLMPGQYDLAYTTKVLGAYGQGIPVVFTGVGPTRDDIEKNNLGWASDYDVKKTADSMLSALKAQREEENCPQTNRFYLRKWLLENRASSLLASKVVDIFEQIGSTRSKKAGTIKLHQSREKTSC